LRGISGYHPVHALPTVFSTGHAMKAVRYLGPGHIEIADVARPIPGENEVLVELRAACISNQNDIRIYNGYHTTYPLFPGAPGAEGSGVVADVGAGVKGFKAGDPVAMIGSRLYAEFSVRKPSELAPLAASTNLVEAAPLGLAGAVVAALSKVQPLSDRSVIVAGLGATGLMAIQIARQFGARKIIGLDLRPVHFELAQSLGASVAAYANDREIINSCREKPADIGIDCSGAAQSVSLLWTMCSNVLAFGFLTETVRIDVPQTRPVRLVNGFISDKEHEDGLAAATKMFLKKKLVTRPIVSQTMRLEEYALAMQKVRRGEVIRMILTR
jgi:NADPH:quinone reductase-like Zn-dependent oxidoreductase